MNIQNPPPPPLTPTPSPLLHESYDLIVPAMCLLIKVSVRFDMLYKMTTVYYTILLLCYVVLKIVLENWETELGQMSTVDFQRTIIWTPKAVIFQWQDPFATAYRFYFQRGWIFNVAPASVPSHFQNIFPAGICRQGVFLYISVDMTYCGWLRSICILKSINCMLSILKKLLIVGSSAPSHLVFGILRFRKNIWHFIKTFW